MARYKPDKRYELQFLACSLDDLLPPGSLARSIWTAIECLDFSMFDASYVNDDVGRLAVNPRSLTAVWILALLRGITSSVRLAELCGRDVEFRWLLGDAHVEKSTLCDFRKNDLDKIKVLGAQCLAALAQQDLLPGKNMGVDGTIIRAAASRHSSKKRYHLERSHARLETLIAEKLAQEDGADTTTEVKSHQQRQQKLQQALSHLDKQGKTSPDARLTITEPDAPLRKQKDGSFAPGYNIQAVTDLDSGVIVSVSIVDAGNDCGQLQSQVEQAQAVLNTLPKTPCIETITADSAYHDTGQLHHLESANIHCYVSETRIKNRKTPHVDPEYQADKFTYDEATNTLCCPKGCTMVKQKFNRKKTAYIYQAKTSDCQHCPAKNQCCPNADKGRRVSHTLPKYQPTLNKVSEQLQTDIGRHLLNARWVSCEGIYARLIELLHWDRCRMWHKTGALMELCWRQFIHNLLILCKQWKPLIHSIP